MLAGGVSEWIAVEITLPPSADETMLELLSSALFEIGSAGIETRDAKSPIVMVASFPPETIVEDLPPLVHSALEAAHAEAATITINAIAPVDWANHWKQHFKPLAFGALHVVPSWLTPPEGAQRVLWMDPGMAFGTGSHETTALCLERIAELSPVRSILDVGTGTGILAMGALLLGATRAVGTDNDPEALLVARENAEKNGLEKRLELSPAAPDRLGERFDLVVANILSEPLIDMAARLRSAVAPGGRLILSGILATQAEGVAQAYEAVGLRDRVITTRGEWVRIDLVSP